MAKFIHIFILFSCLLTFALIGNNHEENEKMDTMNHKMAGVLDLSIAREGSGTAWQPETSPLSMIMLDVYGWQLMFHGSIFIGGDFQGSKRGGNEFLSTNSFMASAGHKLGPGQIVFRTMLSLEPLTINKEGYPLLLQTGSIVSNEEIHGGHHTHDSKHPHDRQHPHDLFMELAVKYAIPIKDTVALFFYAAPIGEPALGPVAYPHRASARFNPLAPIGLHWYESSHSSFGVLTMGIFDRKWMLEGSWFNGRHRDNNPYNIELMVPNSYAGRLSFNPTPDFSLQASYGFIKNSEHSLGIHRVTSSASTNWKTSVDGNLASTLMFGLNISPDGFTTGFALAESNLDLNKYHTLFSRIELGTKTGEELVLSSALNKDRFLVGACSLGYALRFPIFWKIASAIGGVGTLYATGSKLDAYYNGPAHIGGMIFAHLGFTDQE